MEKDEQGLVTLTGSNWDGPKMAMFLISLLVMASTLLSRFEVVIGSYTPRIEHIVVAALFPVFSGLYLLQGRGLPRVDLIWITSAAWLLINGIASFLNAPMPQESIILLARLAILPAILVMVSITSRQAKPGLGLVKYWILFGSLEAMYGILATFSAYFLGTSYGVQRIPAKSLPRPYGTMLEANIFASHIASIFIITLCIYIWQRHHNKIIVAKDGWMYSILWVTAISIVLATTRAVWISIIVTTLAIMIYFYDEFKKAVILFLNLVAAFFVGFMLLIGLATFSQSDQISAAYGGTPTPSRDQPGRALRTSGEESVGTIRGRLQDWKLAYQDWLEYPIIGNGTGSFSQLHGRIRGSDAWISNWVLHLLVDSGLMGLLTFASGLFIIIIRAVKAAQFKSDSYMRIVAISFGSGLILLLIAYLATDAIWFGGFWVHLGLMSGLLFEQSEEISGNLTVIGV